MSDGSSDIIIKGGSCEINFDHGLFPLIEVLIQETQTQYLEN